MKQTLLSLHDQSVALRYAVSGEAVVECLFGAVRRDGQPSSQLITIREGEDGRFSVANGSSTAIESVSRHDVPNVLMEEVVRGLIENMASGVALHAGAVMHNARTILVAGPTGAGKTSLIAWLVDQGFDYRSDELAILPAGEETIVPFPRALVVKAGSAESVSRLHAFSCAPRMQAGPQTFYQVPTSGEEQPSRCGLIIFPRHVAGADLRIEWVPPAQAAAALMACNLNARNLADGGIGAIAALCRTAPAISLQYADFEQLEGVVEVLTRFLLDSRLDAAAVRRLLSAFPRTSSATAEATSIEQRRRAPAPTPRAQPKRLTIGMATYDDYDGVYFTLQSLRLHHPEILAVTEFLVIDNNPGGPCAEPLKAIEQHVPNYRYVPLNFPTGTAVRDCVFEEASGELVLCLDCHVLIVKGAVRRLLDYFDANENTRDLLQGPMLYDDLARFATHFGPAWREGMFGCWESDERGADPDTDPFEIPMQGLGLFACRRDAWPGFNPRFRGFGGEEGYIHEKFRRAGGRTLCLPFLRWVHRFHRPMGIPYRNAWEDRLRNYMIGFREIGLPTTEVEAHFKELLGEASANRILEDIAADLRV